MYPIDLTNTPKDFELINENVIFNPKKHLQLEEPKEIFSLKDFGYSSEVISNSPANFAATSVFRILSDEGSEILLETTKKLEKYTTSNPRIDRNVRGGVYRSNFLRDLCLSEEISEFLSNIAGIKLSPHTIPHQLGHLNFNPLKIGKNVDKWHVDTLIFDYVMFVTDPKKNKGGQFQYFFGTKEEMAYMKKEGKTVPPSKIISPEMPGPGYAILQQGNLVVHQAKGLTSPGERITLVNGYIPNNPTIKDYTRFDQLCNVDPVEIISKEFSDHTAIQVKRLLEEKILNQDFTMKDIEIINYLENASEILSSAIKQLKKGKSEIEHFGD